MQAQITEDFKNEVFNALMAQRSNFTGTDEAFAIMWDINKSVFSRLKKGERENLLPESQWLHIANELGVNKAATALKLTRTEVLNQIEEEVRFCKDYSKAMIFVDDPEIGKTRAAKYLSQNMPMCFYIDGSEARTAHLFIRTLAKTIGIDNRGKIVDVRHRVKACLRSLPKAVILIDDGGYLKPETFVEIIELWNSTEGIVGWYMLGDDALENLIDKAITSKKPGFRAFFSRFSSSYSSATPRDMNQKVLFYKKLIEDVLSANMANKSGLAKIVSKCIKQEQSGHIGGLRRAESLLILNS